MKWPNLDEIYVKDKIVFPKKEDVFKAFIKNPRVVILGQDPYHNDNEATGLAFAVPNEVKNPPSLRNIFKELENDLGIKKCDSTLLDWKKQGILLLNTSLTVEKNKPNSHQKIWKPYITEYIKELGKDKNIIWVLWGSNARSYKKYIAGHIIESVHPSPLSSYRGFFGSKPFSKINALLKDKIDFR